MKKITCNYGYSFLVSFVEVNNEPTLEINFNIKSYQLLSNGWKTVSFPPNIVLNDKLYISQEMVPNIVEVLDNFIKTGELNYADGLEFTNRGFSLLELEDIYGSPISIQQSSAASEACLWFGGIVDTGEIYNWKNDSLEKFKFPIGDVLIADRLHINRKKANNLKLAISSEWKKYLKKQEKTGTNLENSV